MSPAGIFVGLTQAELNTLRASAITRIQSGERTSLSGGGKSGSKAWSMSAADVLREVKYAEAVANGGRVSKVVQDLTGYYPVNG